MPQVDIRLVSVADTLGFQKIEAAANGLKSKLAALPQALTTGLALGVGSSVFSTIESTLKNSFSAAFELAEEIHKGALALGASTEAYQVLSNVMKRSGGDIDQLNKAVTKTNISLFDARDPASKAAAAYRQLGLNAAEVERLPLEKRLEAVGKAFSGSKDQTAAFNSVSEILGTRNLPVVLSALQKLAGEGYDQLSEAMKKAGKIMSEDTIDRLHAAEKQIASFKKVVTIQAGEAIGTGFTLSESLKKAPGDTFVGLLKAMFGSYTDLATAVGKTVEVKKELAVVDDGTKAANLLRLTQAQAKAEDDLVRTGLELKTVQSNQNVSDFAKKEKEIKLMEQEIVLRNKLIDIEKAIPAEDSGQSQAAKDLKIAKLEQQNAQLRNAILFKQSDSADFNRKTSADEKFQQFNEDNNDPRTGALSGIRTGIEDWVVSAGTASQQAAEMMKTTLGSVVDGITGSISGWVRGTETFAQGLRSIGQGILQTMLHTIVQMGVQWLTNAVMIRFGMQSIEATGDTLRAARVVKENAANAATLPGKTAGAAAAGISSFGVALAFGVAAIALIAALSGGFAEGGFTSPGSRNKVAGVVHAGEWVAPQWMLSNPVSAEMIAGLEQMRTTGGIPQLTQPGFGVDGGRGGRDSSSSGKGWAEPNITQNLAFFHTQHDAESWARSKDGRNTIIDIVKNHGYRL